MFSIFEPTVCMCLTLDLFWKKWIELENSFDVPQNQLYVTASKCDLFLYCTECIRMVSHFCWLLIEKGQTRLSSGLATQNLSKYPILHWYLDRLNKIFFSFFSFVDKEKLLTNSFKGWDPSLQDSVDHFEHKKCVSIKKEL